MFETTVDDASKQLGLEQKVAETRRADADVRALLVLLVIARGVSGAIALLLGGNGGGGFLLDGLLILLLVVNKIVSVVSGRHGKINCQRERKSPWKTTDGRVCFSNIVRMPKKTEKTRMKRRATFSPPGIPSLLAGIIE